MLRKQRSSNNGAERGAIQRTNCAFGGNQGDSRLPQTRRDNDIRNDTDPMRQRKASSQSDRSHHAQIELYSEEEVSSAPRYLQREAAQSNLHKRNNETNHTGLPVEPNSTHINVKASSKAPDSSHSYQEQPPPIPQRMQPSFQPGIATIFVPRRNEVAEGGYWITLRPSVRPSVRPFTLNNLKTFGRILMISHTGL